jgi:TRAP transporter TAXI family solute receptor
MKLINYILLFTVISFSHCSKKIEFIFAGGFAGGTYYKIGESLSVIKDFKVTEISTDGSLDNLYKIADHKADFSISQLDVLQNLAIGDRDLVNKIKILFPIYGEEVHIVVSKKISSLSELKGKKISIGDSESGTKFTSLIFLDQFGINNDNATLEEINSAKSLEMLLNGSIDGFILVAGAPVKLLLDLPESASEKIHLLEFSKESLQSVRGTNLTYQRSEIPASTYSWEIKPISTIVVQSVMITRSDLDEKIISQFTKSIYKEKEILSTRHDKWKSLNKETLSNLFNRNPDLFHSSLKTIIGDL